MTPTQPAPRIFVSYSSKDRAFAQRVVADLQHAGAIVWYDVTGIDEGDFIAKINDALRQCEWFVLVLTPNAIASGWVNTEVNAAIHRRRQGFLSGVYPVLAAQCPPGSIPPLWDTLHRFDATVDYAPALADLGSRMGLAIAPVPPNAPFQFTASATLPLHVHAQEIAPAASAPPIARTFRWLSPRLADLGFRAHEYDGTDVIVPPVCMVPAGEFLMGTDPKQDAHARADEQPQHRVTLPAFHIARFPVTVAEYACFAWAGGNAPRRYEFLSHVVDWQAQLTRLDHPVVCVSWHDAKAYAAWLAQLTGQPWRLPTEAEWEKAGRWDPAWRQARIYPWGDTFDKTRCNAREDGAPVGAYPGGASPSGAQDIVGNVWEWTSSVFNPYPYLGDDGRERSDSTEDRVLRGSSWAANENGARAACRNHYEPDIFYPNVGFRLVLGAPGSS